MSLSSGEEGGGVLQDVLNRHRKNKSNNLPEQTEKYTKKLLHRRQRFI